MLPSAEECARLDQWFERLLDAADNVRAEILGNVQRNEPELYASLVQLLEFAQSPSPVLDPQHLDRQSAWQLLGTCPHDEQRAAGERIGAWRTVRHIACGGMGNVYEVARADGAYTQRAALKLILNDIDSRDFLERFARERQILAALNHSGIARLIDGGEDSRHRPYLVMEYVDGLRIDHHCQGRRLDLRGRLQLFVQVAGAVEHAHQQRVVHRDIKPSNITVTADGAVKLLDFGIAKMLGSDVEQPLATHTVVTLLTPQYSTPEQILGQPVDYPADIYQLGLLLFELLTGQRAQDPVDGTPGALVQTVCIEERIPPSECAAKVTPDASGEIGGLAPAALARELRGDLDWIVLKALRLEPARRYVSVQALREDVERYLCGLPVRARPETYGYRAGKFMRRHPWGVASTAAAFLLTIAYALTTTVQARLIAAERDRATTQARLAEQVKTLVLSIFAGANPEQALGKELTARQLLDIKWPLIEAQTREQPRVQSEILETIAETYRQLGSYDQARERLDQAQRLLRTHPELPIEVAAAVQQARGRLLTDTGDYEQAAQALQHAQTLFRQRYDADHAELAATLRDLGYLEHKRGRNAAAEQAYRAALDIYRSAPGDHRRAIADCMERLAVTLTQQSKYLQAAPLLEETLSIQRQLLPEGHPDIAGNLSNLAEVWRHLGRHQEAEALFREALSGMQASRGANHPFVASIMNNLARVLILEGDMAQAETFLDEALAIRRTQLGERHELVAMNLSDLGSLAQRRGNNQAAKTYFLRALAILPEAHRWRGPILTNLGRVYQANGDLPGAERLYRQSLAVKRAAYGNEHEMVAISLELLGKALRAQSRNPEAAAALQEAQRIFRLVHGAVTADRRDSAESPPRE